MERKGIITARTCPRCGHHEVGITTKDGVFHPLKPGMLAAVIEPSEDPVPPKKSMSQDEGTPPFLPSEGPAYPGCGMEEKGRYAPGEGAEDAEPFVPWCPDAIRGNQMLRKKYGVLLRGKDVGGLITPEEYKTAYLEKLQLLIAKEIFMPVAVLLDRYFTVPHLASGTPKQIAEAMWHELNEVQEPAIRMCEWIAKQDVESFARLIHPLEAGDVENEPAGDGLLGRELEGLSLEDFLELLQ